MVRWTTTASVVLLAAIAAIVSYRHMHELVVRHGETAWTASVLPLSVDGMIAASSMALLADSRHGRRSGILPWALLVAGSVASLAANVAVAEPTPVGRLIAAWPSFALIGSYELLMRQIRHSARRNTNLESSDESQTTTDLTHLPATTTSDEPQTAPPIGPMDSNAVQTNTLESEEAQTYETGRREVVSGIPSARVPDGEASIGRPDNAEDGHRLGPRRQSTDLRRRAWEWALANRGPYGQLPSGRMIGEQFGRKERWGRLTKNAGMAGRIQATASAATYEEHVAA
jgi:hypothetical protein